MPKIFIQEGHSEKILQKLWKQCESDEFCDVVLIAGIDGKRISAQRNVLSAASDYFTRMFASPMRESISREVEMPSVDGVVLQSLVEYCYTGTLTISEGIAVELLETAHMLLLKSVVVACENFLIKQLDPSNCFGFAHLAERYDCEMLLQKAEDYTLNNFMDIYGTDEFLNLNAVQLGRLLGSDELCVSDEENIFHSLKSWIQHDPTERVKHKVELLKFVRMPLLKSSFMIEHVKPFCDSTDCQKLYIGGLESKLLSYDGFLDESKSIKPRRSESILMAVTHERLNNQIFLHYFCTARHKWMKWVTGLEERYFFAVAIMEDDLFIVGGRDASSNVLNTVICLNLKTLTLKPIAPMHESRASCSAFVLGGFLYAIGGLKKEFKPNNSVEKWNPKTNEWDFVTSMPIVHSHAGAAVLNGKLYAIGGSIKDKLLSSGVCYDSVKNVWQSIEPMVEGHQLHGVTVANGLLYVVSGFNTKTVERYDPKTNIWTTICSLREEIQYRNSCTTFHDKVTVCYADRMEQYDDMTNEWESIDSLDGLVDASIFSYSHKLPTSKFTDN